ncbi:putative Mediator of RNA polymerase II transcription subunit 18 [Senna tora]|uniref:Putative Mediator of RNA polymerase II transcription subunit 18 n=1 Tax=Senna tora TaxID=362788 RepID=A0A834WNQ8_9FABA|nr:putative Mediator of RNA polymerase II transcription subunit 18 [Senna tora]
MQSTSLPSPSFPISNLSPSFNRRRSRTAVVLAASRSRGAADRDSFGAGRLVDENMIVLRKRIHEMKMMEKNYEPPSDWMEWEKRYYTSYDSIICDVMGVLQRNLMNTRPSLALGMMALIAMSVPTSSAFLLYHLLDLDSI